MQDTPEYQKAEKTALNLIARAEQCSAGLSRKLKKRKHDTSVINRVIFNLTEKKLIDDSRYARFWLQSRLRFTRSPRQLLSSLCAKGIDREEAASALSSVLNEETEFSLLERFVKKYEKKAAAKKNDKGNITRSLKFMLKNEGFNTAAIQKFLDDDERRYS